MILLFCRFDFSGFFCWEFVKGIVYLESVQNVNELHDQTVEAAECVTIEMLSSIILMNVMPLMVPILRSTGHIRDL